METPFVFVECGEGGVHVAESEYAAYVFCDEQGWESISTILMVVFS